MEVALELEDDLFFADLSKEIALLIMEEDEDPLTCPADSLEVLHYLHLLKHMQHTHILNLLFFFSYSSSNFSILGSFYYPL